MTEKNASAKLGLFLVGAGFGALAGILFAPKSGKETRKYIGEKAGEGKELVAAKGRELRKQAEEVLEQGESVVAKGKEQLAEALETGKRAYRTRFVS